MRRGILAAYCRRECKDMEGVTTAQTEAFASQRPMAGQSCLRREEDEPLLTTGSQTVGVAVVFILHYKSVVSAVD